MEKTRLQEARERKLPWKKWGPYLSERQWGTVREDYSSNGDAWNYFTHDHARSRAYLWGEDGIAGISDDQQNLCFSLALWNGKDPILKERMFGLTNPQGNHGEDVKEYYFYLDNTPTHSYMKYLYKYPQKSYPYDELIWINSQLSRNQMEYELMDTGIFKDNRYFDVFIEYAKNNPEDILIKISAVNRGPEAAEIHLLPTLWFRNDWSSLVTGSNRSSEKPLISKSKSTSGISAILAKHVDLGDFVLNCEGDVPLLFTENETNNERIFPGVENESDFVKDGINDYVVDGLLEKVNPKGKGTKSAAHYRMTVDAGKTATIRLRLTKKSKSKDENPFGKNFEKIFANRISEADDFYNSIIPPNVGKDESSVMRQALSGMLWGKQFFFFDVHNWLEKRNSNPLFPGYNKSRNSDWHHMLNKDIISMPDKWEYPWYAAWDLAFHAIPLSIVDPDFAKEQMELMLRGLYLHPNGQMPAYEWNFSDVNPPVHAWATLFLHKMDIAITGESDLNFLKSTFNRLVINFTWWVNRKDRFGKNVFEGGFLGLDNIGIFDRSAPLPTGGHLEQADGTAWMALFSQNMLEMASELAMYDKIYEEMILKFVQHFLFIAVGINKNGPDGMWDEEDGFYYDLLRLPDGSFRRLKVRSLVGLLPLCATSILEKAQRDNLPSEMTMIQQKIQRIPELLKAIHPIGEDYFGVNDRGILALLNKEKLERILEKMLDENEFLSPHGIRSLSKFHEKNPYVMHVGGQEFRVDYLAAESDSGMFGGNSNWRGPVWIPMNLMIIRALQQFYLYYGDNLKVEFPTGSGNKINLFEVSKEISYRLIRIFTKDENGRRPVYGGTEKFQTDPHWNDHILFYEYFHGDNGAGLGASHQTGWTGIVAKAIQFYSRVDAKTFLEIGAGALYHKGN